MFGGANQVTGICSCLVAKAISWSSRRQESGQHSLWGDVGTLRGGGGHYLPIWQSLGVGAALAGCSFANRCLCSSGCEEGMGDIFSGARGFASRVCAPHEGRRTFTVSQAPTEGKEKHERLSCVPRTAPAFLKPLRVLETPLNDQAGVFKFV